MRLLGLSALVILLLDQASKYLVVFGLNLQSRQVIDVLPPLLNFHMAWNRGVNFGLLNTDTGVMRWGLVVLALVISAAVVAWVRRQTPRRTVLISAGVLVGGALGNTLDRIFLGAVADFLNMSCCGIHNPFSFNLADVAVFAGALGLILFTSDNKTP